VYHVTLELKLPYQQFSPEPESLREKGRKWGEIRNLDLKYIGNIGITFLTFGF
jgi:hypothetical protein